MVGTESMTSMDWMFLALSSMGNSQRQVAETFVQRLLSKGEIHPAVAILIGLGEASDAIEVYVSQKYYMESVLLTCLIYPRDWQRISHLVRKWGEVAVAQKQPELAVRCFSCTSMEASEAYLSPRAQDAAYTAQQAHIMGALSPPLSPPGTSSDAHQRMKPENSGLKLITSFNHKGGTAAAGGVTPIDGLSAMTPNPNFRTSRLDPNTASARTVTPGGYGRKRLPSRSAVERLPTSEATPLATTAHSAFPTTKTESIRSGSRHSRSQSFSSSAASMSSDRLPLPESLRNFSSRSPMASQSDLPSKHPTTLPSPAHGIFDNYQTRSSSRNGSRTRKPDGLHLEMHQKIIELGPETGGTGYQTSTTDASSVSRVTAERQGEVGSPPLTGASLASTKVRAIDNYISSLQEANFYAQQQRTADKQRASSRQRGESRNRRDASETREARDPRGRSGVRYIKPSKRSPSSPVSMSPDDPALQLANQTFDDENFYRVTSPVEGRGRSRSKARGTSKQRSGSKRAESPRSTRMSRSSSKVKPLKVSSRRASPERLPLSSTRGRSATRGDGSLQRSPSSPLPMSAQAKLYRDDEEFDMVQSGGSGDSGGERAERTRSRNRQRSTSRRATARSGSARREGSPDRHRPRDRSNSRHPVRDPIPEMTEEDSPPAPARRPSTSTRTASRSRLPRVQTNLSSDPRAMSKKELAAKELEERRLSLARRPSAPSIPHPTEIEASRSPLNTRSPLQEGLSATQMSHTPMSAVSERGYRPEFPASAPQGTVTGTSTSSVPIGLPATPRAMRHPKYMTADPKDGDDIPAIPEIPKGFAQDQPKEVKEAEDLPMLLPATTYSANNTPRSASVPAENLFHAAHQRRGSASGNSGHVRKTSAGSVPKVVTSIDQAISESNVVIVEELEADPPILPELQHLAGPPPPPPPPGPFRNNSAPGGVMTVESPLDRHATPAAMTSTQGSRATTPAVDSLRAGPTPTQSPQTHRRGRGSVSENVGSKFRSVRDRMRSTSRNRVRSPANDDLTSLTPSPYESVLPPATFSHSDSLGRTASPPTHVQQLAPYESVIPPMPGNPNAVVDSAAVEYDQRNQPFQGYRNPKEIRANMPPDMLQQGVYSAR